MQFTPRSVTLNGGVNVKVKVIFPPKLNSCIISKDVWEKAAYNFNKELDKRSDVSETINRIKVDVYWINWTEDGNMMLWMTSKKDDVDSIKDMRFILSGTVVFKDDSDLVEQIIIKDILHGTLRGEKNSIFNKKNLTS